MTRNNTRVLVVEDESIVGMEIQSILESVGYRVLTIVNNGQQAIEVAEAKQPDIILMDMRIKGDLDGIDTAEIIRSRLNIPVVFSTAYLDPEKIDQAKLTMPFGYLLKPIRERELKVVFEIALYVSEVDRALKQAEQKAQESEEKYRIAFETNSDAVTITRMDGLFIDVNPGFVNLTGYTREEVIGKRSSEIDIWVYPEERPVLVDTLMNDGQARNLEVTFRCKNGSHLIALLSGSVIELNNEPHIFLFSKDITEQVTLQKKSTARPETTSVSRMYPHSNAISIIAGGITHNFNNILSVIVGNAEFALRYELKEGDPGEYSVQQIMKTAHRARGLTRQILTLSRWKRPEPSPINLGPITKEVSKFLKDTIPADISVCVVSSVSSDVVMADPVSIHQILVSLCALTMDAIGPGGGSLEIGLSEATVNLDSPAIDMSVTYTRNMRLEPGPDCDTIVETLLDELGIRIEAFKGRIDVTRSSETGCRFSVILPMYQETEVELDGFDQPLSGGRERILFVDDDKQIIEFMERSLDIMGYEVTVKERGEDALKAFQESPDAFDLLISDMSMEGMTGDQLVEKVLEVKREMPIIICSGHDEILNRSKIETKRGYAVLKKPFMFDELDLLIREVMKKKCPRK